MYQIVLENQKQKSVTLLYRYFYDVEVSQNAPFVPFFSLCGGNVKNKTMIGIENFKKFITL